jgi:hypothetical protein
VDRLSIKSDTSDTWRPVDANSSSLLLEVASLIDWWSTIDRPIWLLLLSVAHFSDRIDKERSIHSDGLTVRITSRSRDSTNRQLIQNPRRKTYVVDCVRQIILERTVLTREVSDNSPKTTKGRVSFVFAVDKRAAGAVLHAKIPNDSRVEPQVLLCWAPRPSRKDLNVWQKNNLQFW